MMIMKASLLYTLTRVLSALDNKKYSLYITNNITGMKGITPGGYIKESYRNYTIIDSDNKDIILEDKELVSSQRCYSNYNEKKEVFDSQCLEDEDVKNILYKKVMDYPELVKFYELLKVICDYNANVYNTNELNEQDINLIVNKMKEFKEKYDCASNSVQINKQKKVRTIE